MTTPVDDRSRGADRVRRPLAAAGRRAWIALAMVAASAGGLRAQDAPIPLPEEVPAELAESVLAWFNDPAALRLEGRAVVPEGTELAAPIALLRGEFVVRGTVRGDVVLLDADLRLEDDGRIEGDVLIVGGRMREGDEEAIAGQLTQFAQTFRWAREGEVLVAATPTLRAQRGIRLLGSRIRVLAGTNYNRIEGLPVLFGPLIESSGENPVVAEGLITFRTETGFTDDERGFRLRLERRLSRPTRYYFGVSAYSEVTPIEAWGLGDLEASLTTFFLHRDYRDYYERHGWSAYAGANLKNFPLRLRLSYRDEKHFSLRPGSPWALDETDRPWRPLPLVGQGDARFVDLQIAVDETNDPSAPSDGWRFDGRLSYGLTGDLVLPEFSSRPQGAGIMTEEATLPNSFSSGFFDLRRYARVDPNSVLSLRAVFAGSLNSRPLPPQFQHVLGGPGSLPGYRQLSLDCGARSSSVFSDFGGTSAEAFPRYGCDRVVLFQAEYRNVLPYLLDVGNGESGWVPDLDLEPTLNLFFNVGRGWSDTDGGVDFDDRADVGAGLEIGSFGAYMAYPFGADRRVNFFLRFQRRF